MNKRKLLRDGVQAALELPPVRALRRLDHRRQFEGGAQSYRGSFPTFAQARAATPPGRKVGYDHVELTGFYRDRHERAFPSDYPVLFWLGTALDGAKRVFDLGGHVGVTYYCYSKYLALPPALKWEVSEVPANVTAGQALAKERGASQLTFTSRFEDADGADVLLALGSLQYIDSPSLGGLLRSLAKRPPHVIVSKLPAHDGQTVYTVQCTGVAYHPYRISNRQEFIEDVRGAGYRLRDDWMGGEQSCEEPFEGISVPAYSGFYFQRED